MSSKLYAACELGKEVGRVMLGTLQKDELTVSEVCRFPTLPVEEKKSLQWNIPFVFHEIIAGLRAVATHDEPVVGISCHSWSADCLLFAADGSLITPVYHSNDPRSEDGAKAVRKKVSVENLYAETGVDFQPNKALCHLAIEPSKRLKRAQHILPIADGFNYLLSGTARVERSLAGATQLYNPTVDNWSEHLLKMFHLSTKSFAPIVAGGKKLGALRPEVAKETNLNEAEVVTTCSHQIAAALAALPARPPDSWAFLWMGPSAVMGTQLIAPIIEDATREASFTNQPGYGESFSFHKPTHGFWILDECRKFWSERDRQLDDDVLRHLAISAEAFEALIDLGDPRFLTPGDMPLKIQQFCRDTQQTVPRKPGSIFRCALEGLALHYRKMLQDIERLTGRGITGLYVLNGSPYGMLNHFLANALQVPVAIISEDAAAMGNVALQAVALGHIPTFAHVQQMIGNSFRAKTIVPHGDAWALAGERLGDLVAAREAA
jgi:rhamnulokinase